MNCVCGRKITSGVNKNCSTSRFLCGVCAMKSRGDL